MPEIASNVDPLEKAKHLRTIHFALIVICLALLNVTLFTDDTKLQRAIAQYHHINDIGATWHNEWTKPYIDDHVLPLTKAAPKPRFFRISRKDFPKLKTDHADIKLIFDGPTWITAQGDKFGRSLFSDMWSPPTLADFAYTWDKLPTVAFATFNEFRGDYIYHTRVDGPPSTALAKATADIEDITIVSTTALADTVDPELQKTPTLKLTLTYLNESLRKTTGIDSLPNGDHISYAYIFQKVTPGQGTWRYANYIVPVSERIHYPYNFRQALLHHSGKANALRDANFRHQFRDLDELTQGYQDFQFRQIDKLVPRWKKEAAQSSKIQLMGISASTQFLSSTGSIAIIVIQLYLFIHLQAVKPSLLSSWTGFPWMAIYEAPIARNLFKATAFYLPIIAIALLANSALEVEQLIETTGEGIPLPTILLAYAPIIPATIFGVFGLKTYGTWSPATKPATDEEPQ